MAIRFLIRTEYYVNNFLQALITPAINPGAYLFSLPYLA